MVEDDGGGGGGGRWMMDDGWRRWKRWMMMRDSDQSHTCMPTLIMYSGMVTIGTKGIGILISKQSSYVYI